MKITEIKKKDLDYVAQVLNSPTFSIVDELQSARQAVLDETNRRIRDKIANMQEIPIFNRVYAVNTHNLGFVFRVVGGEKIGDVIIPIVKGFKSNSASHTIDVIENETIVNAPLYRLYYDVNVDRLKFEYETSVFEVFELNEQRYKDICSLMGLYIDDKIFAVRE